MASDRIVTVPNILSFVRLILAIVFFVAFEQGRAAAAFWLFVVAASTDWVDGWYARRFGQVSRLGRIFDPLVDKVIVCGAWVLLSAAGTAIAPWMALVVTVRELMVTAIRAEMEKAGHDFSAALSGKLKMVLQCLAVATVLGALAWPGLAPAGLPLTTVAPWLTWAAVAATIWSGFEYLVAARSLVR
ncbi:MAG: CDP-diacylglycerol--glycerol-3-phosphate 3-phosphatidyltransferase [Pirellulales bacterium]